MTIAEFHGARTAAGLSPAVRVRRVRTAGPRRDDAARHYDRALALHPWDEEARRNRAAATPFPGAP